MLLSDILKGVGIIDSNLKSAAVEISGISADSRTSEIGDVFLCIKGERYDSHDSQYVDEAITHGVSVVIIERDIDIPHAYIKVADTHKALAVMYANYYGRPQDKLNIIAVTGTNGKTTVTHMLKAIYEEAGCKCALIGTVTNTMTTPVPEQLYPLLSEFVENGIEYVFMEASSHALYLGRLEGIKFRYGIFTNLTQDHLDFHGSMEKYLKAKAILFSQCDIGIINADDKYHGALTKLAKCELLYYSVKDDSDFTAKNIKDLGVDGIRYDFLTKCEMFRLHTPISGIFTVYNTLAAVSCAYHDGISPTIIRNALKKLQGIPGRLEFVRNDKNLNVFIDYAHTPDAMENVLKTLRNIKNYGKLILVFGCGGDRDNSKRPVMGKIASKLADFVIVTSDNSRTEDPKKIINDIMKGIDKELPHTVIENRVEAIKYVVDTAEKNDIILLAGKGHENYEITADGKHPFNESELVRKFTSAEGK
jgi:UDP-N-acetylmuramyl-tripeptide synthetase